MDSLQHHRAAVRARLLRSDHVRAVPESVTWKVNREAQLDSYMRDKLEGGRIVVTDTSRALARAVLLPPFAREWPMARAAMTPHRKPNNGGNTTTTNAAHIA